ncbi:MAG: hypothetical protein M3342_11555 [Bacteroidota bacterium]|nr:hypothetical protein [Flavisolibacter sp.]MBD0351013.1 hypothetical protein [Flavisolibacter sp.]MBD0365908.1 hypothetical protein [Flavisolibacter sp.]MDQ3844634.1 hypothetical protein [Bacteroidota bacterium]
MVHANELRLGNKLYNQAGDIITVQQILHSTIVYDTRMQINQHKENISGSYAIAYASKVEEVIEEVEFTELEPIILTPLVLQSCGLRNFVLDEWIIRSAAGHVDFEFIEHKLRLRQPACSHIQIKYLHQLQNLFFALTGQELAVNL